MRLAQAPEKSAPVEALHLLEFSLAGERYGIEVRHVREVHPFRNFASLPSAPPFVLGVVNVRGRILPVLDLTKFLDLPASGLVDLHRIILVAGRGLEFGLLADVSVGVSSVPVASLNPAPSTSGRGTEYLRGVTVERLIVLDMDRIFADRRIVVEE